MATGLTRRGLLAAATAPLFARDARAMVGVFARPALADALWNLASVDQGTGTRVVHVLVSPGCDHSRAMWGAVQDRLGDAMFRWIPFSGRPDDRASVARLIDDGTPGALEACLGGAAPAAPTQVAMDVADRQDEIVHGTVARLAWIATARPLAAPSLVYATRTGPAFVRGSLTPALLDLLLASAT